MEENKYENIIAKYDYRQLWYERKILLKQRKTINKQLDLIDNEIDRREENWMDYLDNMEVKVIYGEYV